MKIGQKFNTLTLKEYLFYIDNHKRCSDFNVLGLYRSIVENENLTTDEKITVKERANSLFQKSFEFLQLKDPCTYFSIHVLGQEITEADKDRLWTEIRKNQQRILAEKRIKHRNFGMYSKHLCGHDDCPMNGMMIKRGSKISYDKMFLPGDKNRWGAKMKSGIRKSERKNERNIVSESMLVSE